MQSKIRLLLNTADRDTNILFDKETMVRFTSQKPYAEVSKVSKGMERSIAAGRLIDIDEVTGISVSHNIKAIHDYLLKLAGITRATFHETVNEEIVNDEEPAQEEAEESSQEEQEPAREEAEERQEQKEPVPKAQKKGNKKKDSEKE